MRFQDMGDEGHAVVKGLRYVYRLTLPGHPPKPTYSGNVSRLCNLRGWYQVRIAGWRPWEKEAAHEYRH